MSSVPSNSNSFVMEERILDHMTLPTLSPSFDFSIIFPESQRAKLAQLIDDYHQYVEKKLAPFDTKYDALVKQMADELNASEFEIMVGSLQACHL